MSAVVQEGKKRQVGMCRTKGQERQPMLSKSCLLLSRRARRDNLLLLLFVVFLDDWSGGLWSGETICAKGHVCCCPGGQEESGQLDYRSEEERQPASQLSIQEETGQKD
jgi:hypothetical protein